jgi:hypothetical protein
MPELFRDASRRRCARGRLVLNLGDEFSNCGGVLGAHFRKLNSLPDFRRPDYDAESFDKFAGSRQTERDVEALLRLKVAGLDLNSALTYIPARAADKSGIKVAAYIGLERNAGVAPSALD